MTSTADKVRETRIEGAKSRLQAARFETGLFLVEVAKQVGITKGYLSQLENDLQRKPNVEIALKLAQFYGIPAGDLFGDRFDASMECGAA